MPPPFTRDGDSLRLAVRVTARAKRHALGGIVAGSDGRPALAVRLAAPPVDGAANKALIAFLAAGLGIPRSRLRIAAGAAARLKIVAISGVTPEAVTAWIESAVPLVPRTVTNRI